MINSKTHLIIFSKDRAMQLHALLESIIVNCDVFDRISILYTTSKSEYNKAYSLLFTRFSHLLKDKLHSVLESNFEKNLKYLLSIKDYGNICFMVDDDIIFNDCVSIVRFFTNPLRDDECFSLRLGDNIKVKTHFSYKFATDGHFYRRKLIKAMVDEISFINPNKFEAKMQRFNNRIGTVNYSKSSSLIGIPVNKVSNTSSCSAGEEYSFSAKQLNDLYLLGQIIDWQNLDYSGIDNVHKEIKYEFRKWTN